MQEPSLKGLLWPRTRLVWQGPGKSQAQGQKPQVWSSAGAEDMQTLRGPLINGHFVPINLGLAPPPL